MPLISCGRWNSTVSPREKLEGCIISSVVPPMNFVLTRAMEMVTGKTPLLIGPGVKNGLNIRIENPSQLGSNLVVDAVAALRPIQGTDDYFDMGTSTTASVIDRQGRYIGGFISPGVRISLEAGASGTAQLPRVGLESTSNGDWTQYRSLSAIRCCLWNSRAD